MEIANNDNKVIPCQINKFFISPPGDRPSQILQKLFTFVPINELGSSDNISFKT